MADIRVLTEKGKQLFADYLSKLRSGTLQAIPGDTLSHGPCSEPFKPLGHIDDIPFTSRIEMGKYLGKVFAEAGVPRNELIENTGLWSWLALTWFDQLCPKKDDGTRKVGETARYVCTSNWRNYYRHLVASSWLIHSLHGEFSRLMLQCPVYKHNDFAEQLASNQSIISRRPLIEVADTLYWDIKEARPKHNASNRHSKGNVRRLVSFVHQIELTYDLHRTSRNEIMALLPTEFAQWKA